MINKIFSTLLILSLLTTQAFATTQSGLKAAFDELNYSLTVEWDQKDKAFYTEQTQRFSSKLKELQMQGLTNQEVIDFAKSQVKDEKLAKDIEVAFNMIEINKMTSAEASKYMMETLKNSYHSGASYRGTVYWLSSLGVLFIISAAILSGFVFVPVSRGPYCVDRWVCDRNCYYDPYYGYTCYDNCYWACY